jgi:hypothetical protein
MSRQPIPKTLQRDPHILLRIVCMQGPTRHGRLNYLHCCKFVTVRGRGCYKIRFGSRSFEGPAPIFAHPPNLNEVGAVIFRL